jgi:DinB superfamily
MDKLTALSRLQEELRLLHQTVQRIEEQRFFERTVLNKWSAAENVHHLILAVRPLNLAFSLPLPIVRLFGKPNQAGRTYDEVVTRYQQLLREGAKASLPYIPGKKFSASKLELMSKLTSSYEAFSQKVHHIAEEKLDLYLLPHPILGRITLKEMLYFTLYHVHHHHRIIKERL